MELIRSNQEWIRALSEQGQPQADALNDLRQLLLRAALYTLVTHLEELREMEEYERLTLAEDCAQEALMAVLARLQDFRGESKFTTWAYKFGINIALTRARHERWKHFSLDSLSDTGEPLDWLHLDDRFQTADSELPALQAEVGAVIQEIIRTRLTHKQRQVLKWIAFDEIPMDVIAERLETNRNAIYKLLHDARVKVKQQLAALGYEVEEVANLFQ